MRSEFFIVGAAAFKEQQPSKRLIYPVSYSNGIHYIGRHPRLLQGLTDTMTSALFVAPHGGAIIEIH